MCRLAFALSSMDVFVNVQLLKATQMTQLFMTEKRPLRAKIWKTMDVIFEKFYSIAYIYISHIKEVKSCQDKPFVR